MKGTSAFTPVFSSRLAPVFARYVDLKRALGRRFDLPARTLHQRGKITMHVIEIGQVQKRVAFEQLDPAAGVGRSIVQQAGSNGIGPARCPALAGVVATGDPPSREQLDVFGRSIARRQQLRYVSRIVLAVAIQGDYPIGASCLDSGADRRALSALLGMMQNTQLGHRLLQGLQDFKALVAGMIVHVDDLELLASFQSGQYLAH